MAQNEINLFEEGNMMRGVPREVEDARNLLQDVEEFIDIHSAEEDNTPDRVKRSVKQLRESSFLLEDVIDEYMIYEEEQPPDPGCAALSCEIVAFVKTMILRHQIKCKFMDLNSQFHQIKEQETSSRGNINATTQRRGLQDSHVMDMNEAAVVDFEAPSTKLIEWLLEEKKERTVICVVGMTGIGKTTLANKVFSNRVIKEAFDCLVWIPISQPYKVDELLRQLMFKICRHKRSDDLSQGISQMDQRSLTDKVKEYLGYKSYVVIFDDVWDSKFWSKIEFALPNNENGSRILITTKNMEVAVNCKRSSCVKVHEMQPLNLAKSLELFDKKAFSYGNEPCPPHLLDVRLEIVKKCKGLPLAIVAIGGALSVKERRTRQWRRFSENLHSLMMQSSELSAITQRFCFDYYKLPLHLKKCLLYFAIYPEDYEIKSKRLVRQWIAEGFIKPTSGVTLEDVAEEYLKKLTHKCLVEKSSVNIDGKVKGVRIHDLLLVLLREKARDYGFSKFVIGHDWSGHAIIRRLSISNKSDDLIESIESSHVRSLLFFTEEELPENTMKIIPTKYKLLKVLDFENAILVDVPQNVGGLIHLKYLSFRNTELQSLPKSIGKLQNLETLDVRQTAVNELPKEISKLRKLRHLLGTKMTLKGCLGGMESLQTLSEVKIDEDGIELITELGKLRQLTKLSLSDVREEHGKSLCLSINVMPKLENLYIETISKDVLIDLSLVSNPTMLQKLRLHAKLNEFPRWIPKLVNLVELSLSNSSITDDPLESLKDLPNLLVFNLAVDSYNGKLLHFQRGGFWNLKELGIRYLSKLESISIEEGALKSLKELTLMNIHNLKTVPSGIKHLANLEVLNTHFMPTEFEKSIAPFAKLIKEKSFEYQRRRY